MAGYFPHGFGSTGCSLCGRSGEMGGLLDNLGTPEIRNRLGETLEQVEQQIKDTAKRTAGKIPMNLPNKQKLQDALDTARNTLKQDISQGVSKGITSGAEEAQRRISPYVVIGGVALIGIVAFMMLKP